MVSIERSDERTRGDGDAAAALADDLPLADATCVVTGGSRGIGRAIATEFGRQGATVVVNYRRSDEEAATVAETIDESPGTAVTEQADVADFEAVERMADRVRDRFGPVDVLVNNAGITRDTTFERMTLEQWEDVVSTNLDGAFNCTKAFYDDLKEAEEGRLLNVGSVVGQQGNYGQSNYAASKSALSGFTCSLARELAPHGTTANCVAPGFTRTDMLSDVPEKARARVRETIPLNRFADAAEVASVVRFLATPAASYVTGEVINVNGGMYA